MSRVLDVLLAGGALAALAPLLLACAIAVRLSSPGPVLFVQLRLGRHGRPFRLYKFRSMFHGAADLRQADGSTFSGGNDLRVTAVGGWLRRTSLDELPQLFNVLRGDMALVGPRPDLVDQLPYYTPEERRKLAVRPGLTGLAQINGRNRIPWQQRKALDVEYAERRSFCLDLAILLRTIPYVLLGKDLHHANPLQ